MKNQNIKFIAGSMSDLIDSATATYSPDADILGNQRPQGLADDIGAYEYISIETSKGQNLINVFFY